MPLNFILTDGTTINIVYLYNTAYDPDGSNMWLRVMRPGANIASYAALNKYPDIKPQDSKLRVIGSNNHEYLVKTYSNYKTQTVNTPLGTFTVYNTMHFISGTYNITSGTATGQGAGGGGGGIAMSSLSPFGIGGCSGAGGGLSGGAAQSVSGSISHIYLLPGHQLSMGVATQAPAASGGTGGTGLMVPGPEINTTWYAGPGTNGSIVQGNSTRIISSESGVIYSVIPAAVNAHFTDGQFQNGGTQTTPSTNITLYPGMGGGGGGYYDSPVSSGDIKTGVGWAYGGYSKGTYPGGSGGDAYSAVGQAGLQAHPGNSGTSVPSLVNSGLASMFFEWWEAGD